MKAALTLLFLIASVGLFWWIALPIWDEINILRAESARISDALSRLKELEGLRDELINTRNGIPSDKLARLDKFMPEKAEVGALLVSLEQITNTRGIKLKSIDFTAEKSQTRAAAGKVATTTELGVSSLIYGINITSNYERFRALLSALEKSLRLIDVTDISFGTGVAGNFEISIKAKSYYQK